MAGNGPQLPAAIAHEPVTVRLLIRTTTGNLALLTAGLGHASALYAAQSAGGRFWTLSQPLPLGRSGVASVSFGSNGTIAVITTSGSAAAMTSPSQGWRSLPGLPARTVTLAPASGGAAIEALAVSRGTLTVWQLAPDRASWRQIQQLKVPIQYGTSG